MTTTATGAQVIAAARGMLGTPWMHQARLPGAALDCAGLVICTARALGLIPPSWEIADYPRSPDGTLAALCAAHMQLIGAPELGAVIVVAVERDPQHLGIVADYRHGGWSVIHASSHARRVVETRLMWASNFALRGIYRLPGVQP
jgi:cell wall-associated NlpC family hydrolase